MWGCLPLAYRHPMTCTRNNDTLVAADSSAIGVPTGTGGVLRNGGIATNAQASSKGLLPLRRPDSGAIGGTREAAHLNMPGILATPTRFATFRPYCLAV
jgi:hypothetical protein